MGAYAPSIAFTLSGLLGLCYVRRKLGRSLNVLSQTWLAKSAAALAALALATTAWRLALPYRPEATLTLRAAWHLGVIVVGMAAYGGATLALRCSEWGLIRDAFSRRGKKG